MHNSARIFFCLGNANGGYLVNVYQMIEQLVLHFAVEMQSFEGGCFGLHDSHLVLTNQWLDQLNSC